VAPHAGISVVPDRLPSRKAVLAEESFSGEELFSREPIPPLRAGKTDPGRA
jgi:hypothetical protein